MGGLKVGSYGVFLFSLAFFIVAAIYKIEEACIVLGPFVLINLAHYSWQNFQQDRRLANGAALMHIIHWFYLASLGLEAQVVHQFMGMISLIASMLFLVYLSSWTGLHHILNLSAFVVLISVLTASNSLAIFVLCMLIVLAILVVRIPTTTMGRMEVLLGSLMIVVTVLYRCFAKEDGNFYNSPFLVIGYLIGHWLIVQGGKKYERLRFGKTCPPAIYPSLAKSSRLQT